MPNTCELYVHSKKKLWINWISIVKNIFNIEHANPIAHAIGIGPHQCTFVLIFKACTQLIGLMCFLRSFSKLCPFIIS
jgi:hypothetical protein